MRFSRITMSLSPADTESDAPGTFAPEPFTIAAMMHAGGSRRSRRGRPAAGESAPTFSSTNSIEPPRSEPMTE